MQKSIAAELAEVDHGVPIGFLGHVVGDYDFSAAAAAFYQGISRQAIELPFCEKCEVHLHPRREICPNCLADEVQTRTVAPTGDLYSFSTMYTTPFVAHAPNVPYTVGIVTLDVGVSLFGRIDVEPATVAIGMRLRVDFDASIDGLHFCADTKREV